MNHKPLHSTREFVEELKKEKELLVIEDLVDPNLEIAEIQRRVVARRGPALNFLWLLTCMAQREEFILPLVRVLLI